jgi:hypothetical protein
MLSRTACHAFLAFSTAMLRLLHATRAVLTFSRTMANRMRVRTVHSLDAIQIDMLLAIRRSCIDKSECGRCTNSVPCSTRPEIIQHVARNTDYFKRLLSETPVACIGTSSVHVCNRPDSLSEAWASKRQPHLTTDVLPSNNRCHAASCDNTMLIKGAKSMAELI